MSTTKYLPQQFEQKWMEIWEKEKIYQGERRKAIKSKVYCLPMFPYPSGAGLHVGHVRVYTGCDVIARYFRMKAHAVLHPIGWDAFGLPAENAAIKAKKNPMDMVAENIANFKRQMRSLGLSYDWEKEFATSDPDYYQWTQWLFIQFFNRGLLYKKNTAINFCPFCKTGLAEEEVLADGTHERCGNLIVQKEMPQWIFRITTYADRLLKDLDELNWPAGILQMQRNWIGKKEGIEIQFKIKSLPQIGIPLCGKKSKVSPIKVFTTTPVNFGATFLAVAPEHSFVQAILDRKIVVSEQKYEEIKHYVSDALGKTEQERLNVEKEKTGVDTDLKAVNHVTGEEISVWVSDFVLSTVGTGAVQGCPGHDIRDFEFAKKFGIPIRRVVIGEDGDTSEIVRKEQVIEKGGKGKMVNSDFLNGHDFQTAMRETMDYFEKKNWGKRVTTYHLRDWIFSRQRYWGEPIPMIECKKCRWVPVPDTELPIKLPYVKNYELTDTGESPLSKINSFVQTTCPHCGGEARRETDTMPNWAGSCWYFIRFAQVQTLKSKIANSTNQSLFDIWNFALSNSVKQWLPVDWYLGGAEHAVLHLLYARFWVKALYDIGLVHFDEPFLRLRNVGMVLAEDHRKMSKSWGNVVNPDEVVNEYGADALRIYEMFMAPFDSEITWSTSALQGAYRFLRRVWQIYHSSDSLTNDKNEEGISLLLELQRVIRKVTTDIPNVKFNTAIAAMMGFLNKWESQDKIKNIKRLHKNNAKKFLKLLAPFAPFMAEEIWRTVFGEKTSIHLSSWPEAELTTVRDQILTIPVQVNGKLRGTITVSARETAEETVVQKALANEKVNKHLEGRKYKVIYVKEKVLNFVV